MTTIVLVRKNDQVVVAGDGQVSMGNTVVKSTASKVRKIEKRDVVAGFAGSTADALTLFERLEGKLEKHAGNLSRAAVELAKDWRTDKYLRSVDDISKLLNCGADKVSINTAAVQNADVVVQSSKKFGSQCIVVAIDAKKNDDKWEVFTHGGRNNTGIDALEFAKKMEQSGAGELLVTSMDRDGTQVGYDIDFMSKISSMVNIPTIASGGVGNLDHLVDGIKLGNASAVLAASIFHYGKYSVKEAKEYLDSKGIPVRI